MLIKQEVLELQISVDDVFLVQIVDPRNKLSEEFLSILFLEIPVGENVVE